MVMPWQFDDVAVDPLTYKVTRGQRPVPLPPRSLEMLCHLIEHRDRVVPRSELLSLFWPGVEVNEATVSWAIGAIRRELGYSGDRRYPIVTVHRVGYRFIAPLHAGRSEPAPAPTPTATPEPAPTDEWPFVGREQAMRTLSTCLGEMLEGHGALCVLSGEAGVGKSRCAAELLRLARAAGVSTLGGAGAEGLGAPPFWPWIQVLQELSKGAAGVREEARALRATIWGAEAMSRAPAPAQEPDPEPRRRFWFHERLVQVLMKQADLAPTLVVLDDLQWADTGTRETLRLLEGELSAARLLVLVARRGSPSDRQSPQPSRPELAIHLDRFDPATVERCLSALAGGDCAVPERLTAAVHAATAGNPLFIKEVLRAHLSGLAPQRLVSLSPGSIAPPRAASDILTARCLELPEWAQAHLMQASILGESFDVSVLEAVTEEAPERLHGACQLACEAGLLSRTDADHYRFAHALHREAFHRLLSPQARVQAHRKAALALERLGPQGREAEIAHHHYAALPSGHFAQTVEAAVRAAEAASRVCAHADAARFYGYALEAQALAPHVTPRDRAALLLTTALTLRWAGNDCGCREHLKGLFELARKHRFHDLMLRGALALRPTFILGTVPDRMVQRCLEDLLDMAPRGANATRIGALSLLASVPPHSLDIEHSKRLCAEAMTLSAELDEPAAQGVALPASQGLSLMATLYAHSGPDATTEQLATTAQWLDASHTLPPRLAIDLYTARAGAFYHLGDVQAGEHAQQAYADLAEVRHLAEAGWYDRWQRVQRQFRSGRLAQAMQACDDLLSECQRIGLGYGPAFVAELRRAIEAERFDRDPLEAHATYQLLETHYGSISVGHRALLTHRAAHNGVVSVARAALARQMADDFAAIPRELGYLSNLCHLALAALRLRDKQAASALYDRLLPYARFNTPDVLLRYDGSVARFLALLSSSLGRHELTGAHFEDAMAMNERLGHVPILARTQLEYAEWLSAYAPLVLGARIDRTRHLARSAAELAQNAGMEWLERRARSLL